MTAPDSARDMATLAFDVAALHAGWRPLDWADLPGECAPAERYYFDYYGIDFETRQTGLAHDFGFMDVAGFRIATHVWRQDNARGTALVCHGYFDHVGIYRHIIEALLALDLNVVAYDLPGHGLSSGDRAAIDDFDVYQQVLARCLTGMHAAGLAQPWHLVAQSTGGAIAMDYLLRTPEPAFSRVVLLAPLVRPAKWPLVRLAHGLVGPWVEHVKRAFSANSSDPDFLDFLEFRDPLQPRYISSRWVSAMKVWLKAFLRRPASSFSPLVIQGDRDETVDWPYNLKIIQRKFDRPAVHMLSGARHQLANEADPYRTRIRDLMARHLRA
jgi:alpha-beta hydrolase superfamily lysophospholipase